MHIIQTENIYSRRDIVFPGDIFPGTSDWENNNDKSVLIGEEDKNESDGKPGVMTRW